MNFNIIDDLVEEKIEITDPVINIISFDDLISKIEYQFFPLVQCPLDKNDYIKWFCLKVLNVPKEQFPDNVALFINEDNIEDYENFMDQIEYNIKKRFGIIVNDDENRFDNLYNIYYFFIVNPEQILVDYLLYYNFYREGFDFKEMYESNRIKDLSGLAGNTNVDTVRVISSVRKQYLESKNKKIETMPYKDKFPSFINYTRMVFDSNEFRFYDMFRKLNEFSPTTNYDNLDDQINIFLNIRYEDEELITDWFTKIILNTEYREVEITEKIIDPFFMQLKDFDYTISRTK